MCANQQSPVSSESKTGRMPIPRGTGILPVFRIAAVVAVPLLIPLAVAAVAPKLAPFAAAFPGERTFERPAGAVPVAASAFAPFREWLGVSWDADYFYIEGNGLPDHTMMVGITAWQQQVPLPQPYVGDNAWRVPLKPVPAAEPAMIEGRFLRGAIAIAVNGIPIFNPQNNRGEVSYEIGELDQWGGHCGRADDYHYHIAPVHLESVVGKGKPVAYALDGYPVLGLTEADGSAPKNLDECHGHDHDGLGYHYHASEKYPYVLGGFRGEVVEAEGQVDPQPRAQGVREALQALRGAKITGFAAKGDGDYELNYEVNGDPCAVRYRVGEDGSVAFEFDEGRDGARTETYAMRRQGGGGGGGQRPPGEGPGGMRPPGGGGGVGGPRPDPLMAALDSNRDGYLDKEELAEATEKLMTLDRNGDGQLDRDEATGRGPGGGGGGNRGGGGGKEMRGPEGTPAPAPPVVGAGHAVDGFVLSSPKIGEDGRLPVEFTGDGAGVSPPLVWKGAPAGTKSFALIMDHLAPGNEMKSYWVMWDIPAKMTSLPQEATGVGRVGTGFRGEAGYEPPHSQGPGDKTYVLHLYALSAAPEPAGPAERVSREALLEAMEGKILGRADLSVIYARP